MPGGVINCTGIIRTYLILSKGAFVCVRQSCLQTACKDAFTHDIRAYNETVTLHIRVANYRNANTYLNFKLKTLIASLYRVTQKPCDMPSSEFFATLYIRLQLRHVFTHTRLCHDSFLRESPVLVRILPVTFIISDTAIGHSY